MAANQSKPKNTTNKTGRISSNDSSKNTYTKKNTGTKNAGQHSNKTNTKKTGKSTASGKKGQRGNQPGNVWEDPMAREVILIVIACVAILLFLCNFGLIGPIGNAISSFLFGMFGILAYIAPIVIAGMIFFKASNYGNEIALIKEMAAIVLFFLCGVIAEMFFGAIDQMEKYNFKELYHYSSLKHGGGVLSGSIAYFLCHFLSKIGCGFLVVTLMIICLVLITEKSLLKTLKRGSIYAYETTKTSADRVAAMAKNHNDRMMERRERRIEQQELEEQERILRMDKKTRGVVLQNLSEFSDDEQLEMNMIRDDIHEIVLHDVDFEQTSRKKARKKETDRVNSLKTEGLQESLPEKEADVFTFPIRTYQTQENSSELTTEKSQIQEFERKEQSRDEENLQEFGQYEQYENGEVLKETESESFSANYDWEDSEQFGDRLGVMEEIEQPDSQNSDLIKDESLVKENENFRQTAGVQNDEINPGEQRLPSGNPGRRPEAGSTVGNPLKTEQTASKTLAQEMNQNQQSVVVKEYRKPPIELLKKNKNSLAGDSQMRLRETAMRLQQTLANFGVKVTITDISQGPTVTRYEFQPEQGVKVSKIVGLTDDIKLNLAATDIRMEAPIPGKAAIGIEIPNKEVVSVSFRELIDTKEFREFGSNLAFAVGKDIGGKVIIHDISKMPHLLIAGATGSGKSVCINTVIMSLLYKSHPDDVKMIMIDPKVVELSVYNGIPHLLIPVVTEPKKAAGALQWGVAEMNDRYTKFAEMNVRDLRGYNQKLEEMRRRGEENVPAKLPQIVIIVDELADLMMVAPGDVEESICRLAQLARAAGIHLIIATQRPSVDVITGLIKANMPSRIAFAVSSGVDSRTILDMVGAEKLLGKGDMLFYPQGYAKPARLQGAFVSDEEVSDVVNYLKNQVIGNVYHNEIQEKIQNMKMEQGSSSGGSNNSNGYDDYFVEAGRFIIEKEKASIGMLQRVFKIGFNRAARIMDQLYEAGVVGPEEGTKPRKILMSAEQFDAYIEDYL